MQLYPVAVSFIIIVAVTAQMVVLQGTQLKGAAVHQVLAKGTVTAAVVVLSVLRCAKEGRVVVGTGAGGVTTATDM